MTIECTLDEAELLIAILTGAEDAFAGTGHPLVEALKDLGQFRSRASYDDHQLRAREVSFLCCRSTVYATAPEKGCLVCR